ncbi:MAG: hypothetical protein GY817_02560 [bacterium]|nr:hypothetical protein [bacterium]
MPVLPKVGDYAEINGRLEAYNGARQINLRGYRLLTEAEIFPENFKKVSILNLTEMWEELTTITDSFENDLVKFLVAKILQDPIIEAFKKAPAA